MVSMPDSPLIADVDHTRCQAAGIPGQEYRCGGPRSRLGGITVTYQLVPGRARPVAPAPASPEPRAPEARRNDRTARMLALAHHVEALVEDGVLADYAAAARLLGVTRARMSQV